MYNFKIANKRSKNDYFANKKGVKGLSIFSKKSLKKLVNYFDNSKILIKPTFYNLNKIKNPTFKDNFFKTKKKLQKEHQIEKVKSFEKFKDLKQKRIFTLPGYSKIYTKPNYKKINDIEEYNYKNSNLLLKIKEWLYKSRVKMALFAHNYHNKYWEKTDIKINNLLNMFSFKKYWLLFKNFIFFKFNFISNINNSIKKLLINKFFKNYFYQENNDEKKIINFSNKIKYNYKKNIFNKQNDKNNNNNDQKFLNLLKENSFKLFLEENFKGILNLEDKNSYNFLHYFFFKNNGNISNFKKDLKEYITYKKKLIKAPRGIGHKLTSYDITTSIYPAIVESLKTELYLKSSYFRNLSQKKIKIKNIFSISENYKNYKKKEWWESAFFFNILQINDHSYKIYKNQFNKRLLFDLNVLKLKKKYLIIIKIQT